MELGIYSHGPVQIGTSERLYLNGSASGLGDCFLVSDGSKIEFYVVDVLELTVDTDVVTIPSEVVIGGDLNHDGSNIGFFGTAPAAQAAAYTPSNVNADRSYDADATTVAELADVLGTLIADLQTYGLLQ
jgi:phage baseplate assembly protein gpV